MSSWVDIAALVLSGGAIATAVIANRKAEKGNKISQVAVDKSETANGLASDANKNSAQANEIATRALSVTADQTEYDWQTKFDYEESSITLTNHSPNSAMDVAVFIRSGDELIVERSTQRLNGFGHLTLKSDFFVQQIRDDQAGIDRFNSSSDGGFFIGVGQVAVEIHIAFTTELGSRRNKTIAESFS